jgi:hypothetical protein
MGENKMVQSEIEKRNLITTIQECMAEHTVNITYKGETRKLYLIEVSVKNSLFQDFMDTYTGEIDDFKKDLAKKLMKKNDQQTYGVLIDENLKYAFAFNRKFADLNKQKDALVYKTPEEAILSVNGGNDLSTSYPSSNPAPTPFQHESNWPWHGGGSGTTLKYSLQGKKEGQEEQTENQGASKGPQIKDPTMEKQSLLDRVEKLYAKNSAPLMLDGKKSKFNLVKITYLTSTLNDFTRTYSSELDEFKLKLAEKKFNTFKGNKDYNSYCMFVSPELKIMYAFNSLFAQYNSFNQSVEFISAEDVLLGKTHPKMEIKTKPFEFSKKKKKIIDLSDIKWPSFPRRRRNQGGNGPTVFRYALVGKPEDSEQEKSAQE